MFCFIVGCASWDEIHSTPASPPLGMTYFIDAITLYEPRHPASFIQFVVKSSEKKWMRLTVHPLDFMLFNFLILLLLTGTYRSGLSALVVTYWLHVGLGDALKRFGKLAAVDFLSVDQHLVGLLCLCHEVHEFWH